MGQYYYAVASLPQLFFDSEYYPSMDGFLDLCRENVSPREAKAIENAFHLLVSPNTDVPQSRPEMVEIWLAWDTSLRADLAVLRAQSLGQESDAYSAIERIIATEVKAREIFSQETPLAAEETLERIRWAMLDDLEVGHFFDVQKLIIYMMRISILERKARFTKELGAENFTRIYSTVTEKRTG